MFQFLEEKKPPLGVRTLPGRTQSFRMNGLRHNPYVGSFHGNNSHVFDGARAKYVMDDFKCNPLVGIFRHSPSIPSKSLGLKSILYGSTTKTPALSQLQVSRETKKIPTYHILRSLKQIPTRVYSASSLASRSSASSPSIPGSSIDRQAIADPEGDVNGAPTIAASKATTVGDYNQNDIPMCSICIEPYKDGDELRTFACSHCFHNECVSKWIVHRCLSNAELDSFNCPECRQNHITLSEAGSSGTSLADGMTNEGGIDVGISNMSFLQVGESLNRDIGYDFLSDFGSEMQSPYPRSHAATPSADTLVCCSSGTTPHPITTPNEGRRSRSASMQKSFIHATSSPKSSNGTTRYSSVNNNNNNNNPSSSSGTGSRNSHNSSTSSNRDQWGVHEIQEADRGECGIEKVDGDGIAAGVRCPGSSTPFAERELSHESPLPSSLVAPAPIRKVALEPLCASAYSDCGFALPT